MERSHFLRGVATAPLLGTTLTAATAADAQSPERPFRVDVHHHCLPPFFPEAVAPLKVVPFLDGWTPERSLKVMADAGIATAVLSMPRSPAAFIGPYAPARALARRINEYMSGVQRSAPSRFRYFAEVPLPDVQGAIREAQYALDTLGASGIGVATSYGNTWLGDATFAPLWDELNRRKAIVFAHPLSNQCCSNQIPGVADTTVEYGTDTTRTIASLVFSGTAAKFPDVRFIFCHAGGTMPFLIERFRFQARDPKFATALPNGVDFELKKFYYETAQAANAEAMGALTKLVPTSHVLFGTDVPYRLTTENVDGLATSGLRPADLRLIYADNAQALFPHVT